MQLVLELNIKTYRIFFLLFAFLNDDALGVYLSESRKRNKLINVLTNLHQQNLVKALIEYKWCKGIVMSLHQEN